jgi:autotransporter-associated beta strand protein
MEGASLTIAGAGKLTGSSVQGGDPGAGGADGQAFGGGMFLQGTGTIRFSPPAGQTERVFNPIDDEGGVVADGYIPPGTFTPGQYNLIKSGLGTLVLSAHNAYSGGTILKAGTLDIAAQSAAGVAGTGIITFAGKAKLEIGNSALILGHVFPYHIYFFGANDVLDFTGLHFHAGAKATYFPATDFLTVQSGGVTDLLGLVSPRGVRFVAANDGHGGTKVTLTPPHTASLSTHDVSEHWAGDHFGDYLLTA